MIQRVRNVHPGKEVRTYWHDVVLATDDHAVNDFVRLICSVKSTAHVYACPGRNVHPKIMRALCKFEETGRVHVDHIKVFHWNGTQKVIGVAITVDRDDDEYMSLARLTRSANATRMVPSTATIQ